MGSRPIEGYHLCSSEFLAIADHDIVHLNILNGLQTNRTDDKSYGLLISLGQTVRRQIVRSALIRGGQIVRID